MGCSEVLLSETREGNPISRIDAEFFDVYARKLDDKIRNAPHFLLENKQVVSGPFGSTLKSEAYLENGDIPFVRIENIKGGFYIDASNIVYISNADNDRIKNSQLELDDLVLSKVGNTIGYFARVNADIKKCNISENNIGIKLAKYTTPQKHYILTYLNTVIAKHLVLKRTSGNAQPKLNVDDVCYIPIPSFYDSFYSQISNLVMQSENTLTQSTTAYIAAENLLLTALDMQNFTPSAEPVAVKSLSESFGTSGRLDSEYYQGKYGDIEEKFGAADVLSNVCKLYDNNYNLKDKQEYKYIELSNIGASGNITGATVDVGELLPTRARRIVKEGQVIVSSIEGSLASCALITDEYAGALCSTGFYVVDSSEMNSETLLALFKSEPIQQLLKKRCSGTILTAISKEEFLNLPLPTVDSTTQVQIAELVQSSFALRRESEQLLETAKRAVEVAIEQGEAAAMELLEKRANVEESEVCLPKK